MTASGLLRRPVVALAGLTLLAALLLWTQARQIHLWTQDEELFVQLSRVIANGPFPDSVFSLREGLDQRGLQRATVLLLAVPLSDINGVLGFDIARALMCLAFASATIPAWLVLRGVGVTPGWSLFGAMLVVLVPWASVTGSFLTESVAYPAALWALYGAWRACAVPGWRSDLLALGLAALASLARTNLLVLLAVAPAAVLFQALIGCGWSVRAAARRLWSEHPVFAVLLVPGSIVLVLMLAGVNLGPLQRLSGGYVTSLGLLDFGPVPGKFATQVSRIVTGVGVLPAVLSCAWIVTRLRPSADPRERGLALAAAIAFFIVLFSTVYAAPEERYLMLVAPALILPAVVTLSRFDVSAVGVAVFGVIAGLLVARADWPFVGDAAKLLTDPAATFLGRVVTFRVSEVLVGVAIAVVCGLVAWGVSRRPRQVLLGVAAAIVAIQLVQTAYVVTKRADWAGGGASSLDDWTWIDQRVPDDTAVAVQAEAISNGPDYAGAWRDAAFFNRRVETVLVTGPLNLTVPIYGRRMTMGIDDATGEVIREQFDSAPFPRWIVVPTLFRRVGFDAESVARSTYLAAELVHLRGTPTVAWQWGTTDPDGWLSPANRSAELTIYPAGGTGRCLTVTLIAPSGAKQDHRYTLRSGDERRSGVIGGDRSSATVSIPIADGRTSATLRASGFSDLPDERAVGVNIGDTRIGRCGA
jgi:hypothetical protein